MDKSNSEDNLPKKAANSSIDGFDVSQPHNQISGSFVHIKQHSGPIPSADEIEKYQSINPEFAKRFFDMAESNQKHRQEIERKQIDYPYFIARRTQNLSIRFACIFLISGFVGIYLNNPILIGVGFCPPLTMVIAAIVWRGKKI